MVGCGTSTLSELLYLKGSTTTHNLDFFYPNLIHIGFKNIVNVDFSGEAITIMRWVNLIRGK